MLTNFEWSRNTAYDGTGVSWLSHGQRCKLSVGVLNCNLSALSASAEPKDLINLLLSWDTQDCRKTKALFSCSFKLAGSACTQGTTISNLNYSLVLLVMPKIPDWVWDPVAMYCSKHVKRNYSMNGWNRSSEKRNKSRMRGNNLNRMTELVIDLGQEKPSTEPTSPE